MRHLEASRPQRPEGRDRRAPCQHVQSQRPRGLHQAAADQRSLMRQQQPESRGHEDHHSRADRPAPKVLLQLPLTRFECQVDRGEKRKTGEREQSHRESERCEPGRDVTGIEAASSNFPDCSRRHRSLELREFDLSPETGFMREVTETFCALEQTGGLLPGATALV